MKKSKCRQPLPKTLLNLLLLLCLLYSSSTSSLAAAAEREAEPIRVLLLYDSLAKDTPKSGNVEALQQQLAAFGVQVTLLSVDGYSGGMLKQYRKVILVRNAADMELTNAAFVQDRAVYRGDYFHIGEELPASQQEALHIGIEQTPSEETMLLAIGPYSDAAMRVQNTPYIVMQQTTAKPQAEVYGSFTPTQNSGANESSPYAARNEHAAYVPYFQKGNLSELAMSYVLKDWLGLAELGQTYLLFKEIYPFSDLTLLAGMADTLYDAGIPFAISVQPVFSNSDFPAMQRYLETLKYVQSRNGTVLVNAPVVASTIGQNDQTLKTKMTSFIDVLAAYGIAPLGMGAEMYWSYDKEYAVDGMGFFDSAVLLPNKKLMYRSQTNVSQPFASSLYSISPSFLAGFDREGKAWEPLPMNTALTYDFAENEVQLSADLASITESWMTFTDYKQNDHEVRTEAHVILSQGGHLTINGQALALNDAVRQVSSDYEYADKGTVSFSTLFNVQNKIFIIIIIVSLLIFGFLFMIGYRLYRRKYFK
ncbi:Uncharacterized protein YdaL [Paenibacillus algorifonticola]|uniref:Uncharacterized protein YdaL n=1 Tax=Paenibacillus algorifonticola TaxID=684063 RepID=A0A1I2F731_9BACL|nr:hypothetical protein [Paenibacillus algorifonticola]SFF00371.1 Uncharacterized protein YdaL [Paenibacillus algorifonticola]